jgi:uncharacterized protein
VRITTRDELLALYGEVPFRASHKVHAALDEHDRAFVARSPFCLLATSGDQLDVSPRGDHPGFVSVLEDGRLVLPDRPGNNRVDSLLNVLVDPRAALIFLVPGVGQTLRVNGSAEVSTDLQLLALGEVDGRLPRTALVVTPVEVFFQCPRALQRSGLWDLAPALPGLATLDEVLADQIEGLTLEQSRRYGSTPDPLW